MKNFLLQTAALSILRMMMDLILPDNDLKRYADLVVGLTVMLSMLDGMGKLLRGIL